MTEQNKTHRENAVYALNQLSNLYNDISVNEKDATLTQESWFIKITSPIIKITSVKGVGNLGGYTLTFNNEKSANDFLNSYKDLIYKASSFLF